VRLGPFAATEEDAHMAMSAKTRSTIYQGLQPIVGEEAVGEMLSYFPARDVEEPATKEFVRAEIEALRSEMHAAFRQQTVWLVSAVMAGAGLLAAVDVLD
jgi:hypothetical protein